MSQKPWQQQPNGKPQLVAQAVPPKADDFPYLIICGEKGCECDLFESRLRFKARKSLSEIGRMELVPIQVMVCDECGSEINLDSKVLEFQNQKPKAVTSNEEPSVS